MKIPKSNTKIPVATRIFFEASSLGVRFMFVGSSMPPEASAARMTPTVY